MDYRGKNLWILAAFNLFIVILRLVNYYTGIGLTTGSGDVFFTGVRTMAVLAMVLLLCLMAMGRIRIDVAAVFSVGILIIYVLTALSGRDLEYDTLLNLALMVLVFSTVTNLQSFRENRELKRIMGLAPIELDLRIGDRNQLFDPLVIGPHLEIHPEITRVVDRFMKSGAAPAPLQVNIYCRTALSTQLMDTAIESLREHYMDEERRLIGVLAQRSRRSMGLFFTSMSIMFLWTRYESVIGNSAVWTVLGSLGGFFLWEIGNTYFRHMEDYSDMLRCRLSRDASVRFVRK